MYLLGKAFGCLFGNAKASTHYLSSRSTRWCFGRSFQKSRRFFRTYEQLTTFNSSVQTGVARALSVVGSAVALLWRCGTLAPPLAGRDFIRLYRSFLCLSDDLHLHLHHCHLESTCSAAAAICAICADLPPTTGYEPGQRLSTPLVSIAVIRVVTAVTVKVSPPSPP
jgi:hypothetical protein